MPVRPRSFGRSSKPIVWNDRTLRVEVPAALGRLLELPRHMLDLPPTLKAVAAALE